MSIEDASAFETLQIGNNKFTVPAKEYIENVIRKGQRKQDHQWNSEVLEMELPGYYFNLIARGEKFRALCLDIKVDGNTIGVIDTICSVDSNNLYLEYPFRLDSLLSFASNSQLDKLARLHAGHNGFNISYSFRNKGFGSNAFATFCRVAYYNGFSNIIINSVHDRTASFDDESYWDKTFYAKFLIQELLDVHKTLKFYPNIIIPTSNFQ